MSQVLTARQICAEALGTIGSFPITDTAPDGNHLRTAMTWLDLILGELVGTEKVFTRTPNTLSFNLTNGTQTYNLDTALIASLPADSIEFVVDAWLQDQSGSRTHLEVVDRQTFENVEKPDRTGPPRWLYIDRLQPPTLQTFPTPAADDTNVYTVFLVVQTFAPNLAPQGIAGSTLSATIAHDMAQPWQRWMIFQLAHDLGAGRIYKLPEASLNRWGAVALASKTRLLAFAEREHETTPPICDPYDGFDDCGGHHSDDYGNRRGVWR